MLLNKEQISYRKEKSIKEMFLTLLSQKKTLELVFYTDN